MNGYGYGDMLGRTGKNLTVTLDGRRMTLRGEPAVPAILTVNGEEAAINTVIHAGDRISFTPARSGKDAAQTLGGLLGADFAGRVLVNNREVPMETPLAQGDVILVLERRAPEMRPDAEATEETAPPVRTPQAEEKPEEAPAPLPVQRRQLQFILNGEPLTLEEKESGQPYYLMDLLQYSGLDFEHLERPVRLTVNGQESGFRQSLHSGDRITISCDG